MDYIMNGTTTLYTTYIYLSNIINFNIEERKISSVTRVLAFLALQSLIHIYAGHIFSYPEPIT